MSRARLPSPLVVLALLAACSDQPDDTTASAASVTAPAEAQSVSEIGAFSHTPFGVNALIRDVEAAWTAKDAAAFAANYTTDAEFVNPVGRILAGREAIQNQHNILFGGPLAGSTETHQVRRTVVLDHRLLMVDLDVSLTGFTSLPSGLPATEPGVVRTRVKWILVRRHRGWQILAQQMTALPPQP